MEIAHIPSSLYFRHFETVGEVIKYEIGRRFHIAFPYLCMCYVREVLASGEQNTFINVPTKIRSHGLEFGQLFGWERCLLKTSAFLWVRHPDDNSTLHSSNDLLETLIWSSSQKKELLTCYLSDKCLVFKRFLKWIQMPVEN